MKHCPCACSSSSAPSPSAWAVFPQPNAATASSTRVAQLEAIDELRVETWHWQSLMRKPHTPTRFRERRSERPGLSAVGPQSLASRGARGRAPGRAPAAPRRVALHPPLRAQPHPGLADADRQRLLRRAADGHRLPARVRRRAAAPQGHGGQLDAGRADVGRRARAPQRARLLPVAEHRSLLRLDLGPAGLRRRPRSRAAPAARRRRRSRRSLTASSASTIAPPTPPWATSPSREEPQPADRVDDHQRQHGVLRPERVAFREDRDGAVVGDREARRRGRRRARRPGRTRRCSGENGAMFGE